MRGSRENRRMDLAVTTFIGMDRTSFCFGLRRVVSWDE